MYCLTATTPGITAGGIGEHAGGTGRRAGALGTVGTAGAAIPSHLEYTPVSTALLVITVRKTRILEIAYYKGWLVSESEGLAKLYIVKKISMKKNKRSRPRE